MVKKLNKKIKIVVAMSGGIDSSVAAVLLKKAGFDVVGIFMKFWQSSDFAKGKENKNRYCSSESEKLARLTANKIGISFYVINAEKEFKKKVVDYFLKEYKRGATPNPCVVCNKEIKFGLLIEKALALGADFVATGHYARISFESDLHSATDFFPAVGSPLCLCGDKWTKACKKSIASYSKNSLPRLFVAEDKEKDQSYFLWQLNQKQLKHVLFPLGNYTKPEVREIAKKFKLPTVKTIESQEICFVQNTTNDFLKKYLKLKQGDIVSVNGKILGKHQGLWFYTIGQRKGLNINQGPYYVVEKNFNNNTLIVSKDKKDLLKKEIIVRQVNWISGKVRLPLSVKCKIRYKSEMADAVIRENKVGSVKVIFKKPQEPATRGQSAVFYKGREVLGGGVIE